MTEINDLAAREAEYRAREAEYRARSRLPELKVGERVCRVKTGSGLGDHYRFGVITEVKKAVVKVRYDLKSGQSRGDAAVDVPDAVYNIRGLTERGHGRGWGTARAAYLLAESAGLLRAASDEKRHRRERRMNELRGELRDLQGAELDDKLAARLRALADKADKYLAETFAE